MDYEFWRKLMSSVRLGLAGAAVVIALVNAGQAQAQAQAAQCERQTYVHRDIVVLGFPCPRQSDVSIVPTVPGAAKIIKALDVLYAESPRSIAVIERLKRAGPVIVIYDPSYPPPGVHLTTTQIAMFLPTFIESIDKKASGKQFTVIVGRDGIKWPLRELAAVLVHELMGHGRQHLEDRLDTMRSLDVECEAWLYEEMANQDLKIDKLSQEMIDFRQQLEGIHCDDFIRYMRKRTPEQIALWDVQNPDVPKLFKIFDRYVEVQRRLGMVSSAQAAIKRQLEETIQKAGAKGDPDDLYAIGLMYMSSVGQEPDPAEAGKWFLKAAQKGNANAQLEFATLLEAGEGVTANPRLAAQYYAKAAKQDNAAAFYALGVLFETGLGVDKDAGKAKALFAKARPGFDVRSFVMLGNMYDRGMGFPKNPAKAYALFLQAARLGDGWAQTKVGDMHNIGSGVEENPLQAAKWWRRAAQAGDPSAQNNLGYLLRQGRGVKKDMHRAFKLFRKAADQGLAPAQASLASMYALGQGVPKDYAAAVRWYRKSAEQGFANAQYGLGHMYEKGMGMRADIKLARAWYAKAATQGHETAKQTLARLE